MTFYIYPIIVSVKIHNTMYIKPYMAESLLSLRSMNIMYIKYYIKTSVYIYIRPFIYIPSLFLLRSIKHIYIKHHYPTWIRYLTKQASIKLRTRLSYILDLAPTPNAIMDFGISALNSQSSTNFISSNLSRA